MIVAFHGFMGTGADFSPLKDCLHTSMDMPDLVGHGSHLPFDPIKYSTASQVAHWKERIPYGSVIMGYSMGGRLALQLATAYPEHFAGLIVIGGTPGIADHQERALRARWDRQQAKKLRKKGMAEFYRTWQTLPIIASQQAILPKILDPMIARRLRQKPELLALSMLHFGTGTMPDCWERLQYLQMPVLLMVGENDAKYRGIARNMQRQIPQAELAVIPDVGHCAHLEGIAPSTAVIHEFLVRNTLEGH